MKSREQLVTEPYLNPTQISRLLGINIYKAKELFAKADEIDRKMAYRIEPNKVRQKSVLKVAGLTHSDLKNLIA